MYVVVSSVRKPFGLIQPQGRIQVFFFWQNTSCIRKPQVISVGGGGGGGGAPPPRTPLHLPSRSAPEPGRPQAGRGRPPHLLYLLTGIGTYWDLGHWQSKRYHRESVILTVNSRIYPFSRYKLFPLRKERLTSCCSRAPVTFMNSRVSYRWCVRGCSFFVCVGGGHSDIEWLTVVRMVFIGRFVLIKLFWCAVSSL